MNYKSELKGFCFDRALHYHEKLSNKADLAGVMATADKLADYFYMAEKDWQDGGQYMIGLADDVELSALSELVDALENIRARRQGHADRIAAKTLEALETKQ